MVILEHSVERPLNREPPVKDLISSFITIHGAYDRNHGPTPHVDAERHIVHVDGLVSSPLSLSIEALKAFPQHEVICALQCAGNRRHTMRTLLKEVDGVDWGDGAVANCAWRGPKLRDVLMKAGVRGDEEEDGEDGKIHVAFACHQTVVQDDSWYGGSIELQTAMSDDREVILALEMNGKVLPIDHGAPVRVVVPGVAGARSVKWLDRITVQRGESKNFYQQYDYKILPPEATDRETAELFWHRTPAIQDMPVNSVVATPESGATVKLSAKGTLEAKGYALPHGAHGPVIKVEVSGDEGMTWVNAHLGEAGKWSWVLWRAEVKIELGKGRRILSRAVDAGGNVQEESPLWNLRGVGYNGYGEVRDLNVIQP